MKSGYFFAQDNIASSPELKFFYYTGVRWGHNSFPVYLTIDKREISFHWQEDINNYTNHYTLFSIPVFATTSSEASISHVLKSIYNERVNGSGLIHDEFSGYKEQSFLKPEILIKHGLLLDFLFDFKHSQVFQNLDNYYEIESLLTGHFLLSAIWAKNEYFFCREEYHTEAKKVRDSPVKNELALHLKMAEEKWLNIIMKEEAVQLANSNGWFEEAGNELNHIVLPGNHQKKKSAAYYGYLFRNKLHFNRPDWLKYILKTGKTESSSEINSYITESKDHIISFYLNRLSLYSAYKFYNYHSSGWSFFSYLLALFFVGGVIMATKSYPLIVCVISIGCAIGFYFSVLMPLFFFLKRLFLPNKLEIYNAGLALPIMSIAILSSWVTSYFPFSEEVLELNLSITSNKIFFITGIIWFFIVFVITYYLINIIPKINYLKAIIKSMVFMSAGMCFSILIGILILNATIDKVFDNADEYLPIEKGLQRIIEINAEITALNDSIAQYGETNISDDKICPTDTAKVPTSSGDSINSNTTSSIKDNKYKKEKNELILSRELEIDSLINEHLRNEKKWFLPAIAKVGSTKIYLFPRLLLIYGTISLFIGFLAQTVFQSKAFRHPI